MEKEDYLKFASANGAPIARETLKQGNYLAEKTSDDVRIIAEITEGKWKQIEDPNIKCIRHVAFNTAKNHKTGLPVQVSVPLSFMDLPIRSVFSFSVDTRGYTSVNVNKLTPKQIKEYEKETVG